LAHDRNNSRIEWYEDDVSLLETDISLCISIQEVIIEVQAANHAIAAPDFNVPK
jgi:hypothetical protein